MIAKGIYFDDIHSYYDLDLILSDSYVPPAQPKTIYIDLPAGDGMLDLTEAHGSVKYNDRTGCKFTFSMNPSSDMTFEEKKSQVSNALNGKKCKVILDKDPDYYYTGRCIVNEYLQDKRILQIVVTAKLSPYKQKKEATVVSFPVTSTEQTIILKNGKKPVVPEIKCTTQSLNGQIKISFGTSIFSFGAGTHTEEKIVLQEGENVLQVSGNGTVTFTYQEADL